MLGPLLFLIYIHDLHMHVKSKVRLFADDTALYLTISTSSQSEIPQKDLDNLERWSHKLDMELNPSKCQVIHITSSKTPIPTQYTLHNCILESVSSPTYLGVDISSDLSWDTHINRISKRQTTLLAFLGETSRFNPNRLNLLLTKFVFVPSWSTALQSGVHSQIQISLNLKLSNIELPDG